MTLVAVAAERGHLRRVVLSSWLGGTIEYYDFLLYGTASSLVFNRLFFTDLSPVAATFAAFATFAVGYVARPLGGVLFGHYGDRIGRKAMLVLTMTMMGTASSLIGLLPTHSAIGNWAPILLVVLRLCQGVAVGGEWGGSALLTAEHAPVARRGLLSSIVQIGGPTGTVLSTLVLVLFSLLPDDQFLSWGWRMPFLLSAGLLGLGLFVRLKVAESDVFLAARDTVAAKPPLLEILSHPKVVAQACFVVFAAQVTQALTSVFMISYASGIGYHRTDILIGQVLNGIGAAIAMPLATALSDRIGRRPTLLGAALLLAVVAFPVFAMVGTGQTAMMWLALGVIAPLPMGALLGPIPALFAELFETNTRYTGVSVGYQLAAVLGGGLAPLIGTSLLALGGGTVTFVALYMMIACLASATAAWTLAETRGRNLTTTTSPRFTVSPTVTPAHPQGV